jgi:hypothetical protein
MRNVLPFPERRSDMLSIASNSQNTVTDRVARKPKGSGADSTCWTEPHFGSVESAQFSTSSSLGEFHLEPLMEPHLNPRIHEATCSPACVPHDRQPSLERGAPPSCPVVSGPFCKASPQLVQGRFRSPGTIETATLVVRSAVGSQNTKVATDVLGIHAGPSSPAMRLGFSDLLHTLNRCPPLRRLSRGQPTGAAIVGQEALPEEAKTLHLYIEQRGESAHREMKSFEYTISLDQQETEMQINRLLAGNAALSRVVSARQRLPSRSGRLAQVHHRVRRGTPALPYDSAQLRWKQRPTFLTDWNARRPVGCRPQISWVYSCL